MFNLDQNDLHVIVTLVTVVSTDILALVAGGVAVWMVKRAVEEKNGDMGFAAFAVGIGAGILSMLAATMAGVLRQ